MAWLRGSFLRGVLRLLTNFPSLQLDPLPPRPGVYAIWCLSNGKLYVGRSVNVRERLRTHLHGLRKGYHHNLHLQSAFNKFGEDDFIADVLTIASAEDLPRLEGHFISIFESHHRSRGFNIDVIDVQGMRRASIETKLKMATAAYGKTPSDDTRRKMSRSQTGRKHSPESLEKMRSIKVGKVMSRTTRARMSEARRRSAKPVIFQGQVTSIPQLAERFGLSRQSLARRLKLGWPLEAALNTPLEPRKKSHALTISG